ncbi:hypothetical protein GCM10027020_31000 [Nocardioides salsibiostraticola]
MLITASSLTLVAQPAQAVQPGQAAQPAQATAGRTPLGPVTSAQRTSALRITVSNERQLRRAVVRANARGGARTVIRLDRTIRFSTTRPTRGPATRGDLDVSGNVLLLGRGKAIRARGTDRIFDVRSSGRLVLKSVTLDGGDPGPSTSGGAIRSTGRLTLRGSVVDGNSVTDESPRAVGGGISIEGGSARLLDSRISDNIGRWFGGGVAIRGASVVMRRTEVSGNQARRTDFRQRRIYGGKHGGGIYVGDRGRLLADRVVLERNMAEMNGGGLLIEGASSVGLRASTLVENTSFAPDEAGYGGGGIYAAESVVAIADSMLKANSAYYSFGGGIHVDSGTLTMTGSRLRANDARVAGGGLAVRDGAVSMDSTLTLRNSVGLRRFDPPHPSDTYQAFGGGLALYGQGALDVVASDIVTNTSDAGGGGVFVGRLSPGDGPQGFSLRNSTVRSNVVTNKYACCISGGGGGFYLEAGDVLLDQVAVTDNRATGNYSSGAGLFADADDQHRWPLTLRLSNSVFSGNRAATFGGGMYLADGEHDLTDVDIIDNQAGPHEVSAAGHGGGLYLRSDAPVRYRGGVIADNSATEEGGGIWSGGQDFVGTDLTLRDNRAPIGPRYCFRSVDNSLNGRSVDQECQ